MTKQDWRAQRKELLASFEFDSNSILGGVLLLWLTGGSSQDYGGTKQKFQNIPSNGSIALQNPQTVSV